MQTVGAAIGGAVGGPVGAVIGRAAGAIAGNALDQKLFSKDQVVVGPRLDQARLLTSTEGAPIPRVYGRNRISGQIIWATTFEEVVSTKKTSGKGGGGPSTSTTTFSYFANFAVGICEGPVSGIRRMWADGQELDLTLLEFRLYHGDDNQAVDPLIEAKQGSGNSPAYRGTTYLVFEDFPLAKYGNRIPQLSFEVVRTIGKLENSIRSISVIPGATEYGYDTLQVSVGGGNQIYNTYNRHSSIASTDWEASIDELQFVCPNLESVSLVVTWYGTDLRAEQCNVAPGVTHLFNVPWNVAGLLRHEAHLVSQINGRAAFGGTPTDASVLRAIADLKARGLKVTINPFLMMDIPQGNSLAWTNGASGQPAYPWRGEISCFPPQGDAATVDKSALARQQLALFAQRYSAMVRHYAQLCSQAGGVDGFLIGSELRSLTRVRDQNNQFPFVDSLVALASEVRAILGTDCMITYGADWSEYFGYQPVDGSNDVFFNLDPLWASSDISAVGIDNYMPLSDWQSGEDPSFPDVRSVQDRNYLKNNVSSGEGFDWYYASQDDRNQRIRTEITDGLGEPWIFRYKDLVSWWSNAHHERYAGVRQTQSTAWLPASKPIVFTELGCPAIDLGTNQPNVFYDSKSDQSAIPYYSSGNRDDLIQRRFLEAHYEYWSEAANNPVSPVYGSSMIDPAEITPWAWDARPFPWFPLNLNAWSDGENWHFGHWLTGRLGGCPADDLICQILSDFGHDAVVTNYDGIFDGYVIPTVGSAREALEPILGLLGIHAREKGGVLYFESPAYARRKSIPQTELLQELDRPLQVSRRFSEIELPAESIIFHTSVFSEYEEKGTKSNRIAGGSDRQVSYSAPVVMPETAALAIGSQRLQEKWSGRDEARVSLPAKHLEITAGDIIDFVGMPERKWLVEGIEIGTGQDLVMRSVSDIQYRASSTNNGTGKVSTQEDLGPANVVLMDLPTLPGGDPGKLVTHIAAHASPWGRRYSVLASPLNEGFGIRANLNQRATLGNLVEPLAPGAEGRWDHAGAICLSLDFGSLQSADPLLVFNGENLLAVKSAIGSYELIQFRNAELLSDGNWKLTGLLRGQLGTGDEAAAGAHSDATAVLMDESVISVPIDQAERGLELNWRIGPENLPIASPAFVQITHSNLGRSERMLSPVHLAVEKVSGNALQFQWVRRGRYGADSWETVDIPLDAQQERYRVQVIASSGSIVRELEVQTSEYVYPSFGPANRSGAGARSILCE